MGQYGVELVNWYLTSIEKKIFFLKEYFDQKDDLSFNSEDYNHAKNARTSNCNGSSEIVKDHPQRIIQMPKIKENNLQKFKNGQ